MLVIGVYIFLSVLDFGSCSTDRTLVQMQFLSRHGHRCPTGTFLIPNCPVDIIKLYDLKCGSLTPIGEYECYQLGVYVRETYLESNGSKNIEDIPSIWNPNDYYFYTSQNTRTIRSAWSVTKGLFPYGHKIEIPPYTYSLPYASQSIPVYTLYMYHSDRVFKEQSICPAVDNNIDSFLSSEEGQQFLEKYQDLYMNVLDDVSGANFSVMNANVLHDSIEILDVADLLCEDLKPYVQMSKDAATIYFTTYFQQKFNPVWMGGGFVTEVVENIESFLFNNVTRTSTKKKYIQEVETYGYPKFVHFSGHDTTILTVFLALGVLDDYPELYQQPDFGSALFFELYRSTNEEDGSEKYEIQVVFRDRWDGDIMPLDLKSFGCEGTFCDLEVFTNQVRKCQNDYSDMCK